MANITVPIQVNLPEDWREQIIERLKNDPEVEWICVVRCKECKHWIRHDSWHDDTRINHERKYLADVLAWMPLPEPYEEVDDADSK